MGETAIQSAWQGCTAYPLKFGECMPGRGTTVWHARNWHGLTWTFCVRSMPEANFNGTNCPAAKAGIVRGTDGINVMVEHSDNA